jgi:gliding motility-associated-like protein
MRKLYFFVITGIVFPTLSITAQTTVFFDNCNTMGGWTNTGGIYFAGSNTPYSTAAAYSWQCVDPILPPDDHTVGGNCFYTNGNSYYMEAGAGSYILYRLQSPAINLSGYNNTRLEFWMQLRSEVPSWDGAFVEVSTNGTTWTQLTPPQLCLAYDGNMSQNASSTPFYPYLKPAWWNPRTTWTRVMADISAYDNVPVFYVRFTFHSDEAAYDKGWTIDDIRIVSIAQAQVQGNNVVIADNDLTPATADFTDFGSVAIGNSLTHTFYIHNTGEAPLTLTGTPYVSITGTGFSVVNQPSTNTIPAGGFVTFDVQFAPTTVGTINGTINIPNSDNYSSCNPPNPYNFAIRGRNQNTPPYASAWINDTTLCPNTGPVTFNYTIADVEQNPNVVTVTATSSNPAIVPAANIVTGGAGANRTLTVTPITGGTGTTTISVTLNDGQTVNNDSVFTFNITLDDTIAPVAVCQNMQVQLDTAGNGSLTATQVDNGSTDNCSIQQISISQTSFTCADVGQVNVTFTVEDIAGNISTCPFVVDVLPPAMNVSHTTSDYNGYEVSCSGSSDGTITVLATGGCSPFTYAWSHDPNVTTNAATGLNAGNYTITVTDVSGQQQQVQVTLDEPAPLVDNSSSVNISCFGEIDGSVSLAVSGGVAPYQYSEGPVLSGMPAGTYNYTITDNNTCSIAVSITISEPPSIDISGVDYFGIFCGESVTMDITAAGGTGGLAFSWDFAEYLDCPTCEDPVATPDKSTIFTITATDDRECSETFSVLVEADCNVFIPNSFTPNADGKNEEFRVYAGGVRNFEMRIFNRWGAEIFTSQDVDKGWKGTHGTEPAPQGVYVYDIYLTLPNGEEKNIKGHVNLIR